MSFDVRFVAFLLLAFVAFFFVFTCENFKLQEHTNVVTDFSWDTDGSNVLLSIGKDNLAIRHTVGSALRPLVRIILFIFRLYWNVN